MWRDNIKIKLEEKECVSVDWNFLVQYKDKKVDIIQRVMKPLVMYDTWDFLNN